MQLVIFESETMKQDYLKCEICGKDLDGRKDQKAMTDIDGFIHSFCGECYNDVPKREAALAKNPFRK